MKTLRALLVVVGLLTASVVVFAAGEITEVIPLKHRMVDQILPVIRPLIPPPGSISGMNNQLVVRTTPENMQQLKSALERLDTELRRLIIKVRQGGTSAKQSIDQGISGEYTIGDVTVASSEPVHGSEGVNIEHRSGDGSIRYSLSNKTSTRQSGNEHFVQVLEGNQAFIRTGQAVPIPQRTVYVGGHHVAVQDTTQYRSIDSGFYVRPHLTGDQVILDITAQLESRSMRVRDGVDTQQTHTFVTVQLGEWVSIGGYSGSMSTESRANFGTVKRSSTSNNTVMLKVEEAPRYSGRDVFEPVINPRATSKVK